MQVPDSIKAVSGMEGTQPDPYIPGQMAAVSMQVPDRITLVDGENYMLVTRREGAILQSPCPLIRLSVCPSVHTFVTDISASTGRNEFICTVSPFQVYRTSTSCLQCDLEFFMCAIMKIFVTVISASTGRNDFIFDISPFQVYRTSSSCLPCDLRMNKWEYS